MGPARLSRRSLLRGAASVTVVAAVAAVSSCTDGTARVADDAADGSALLRLGHAIAEADATTGSAPLAPPATGTAAITSEAAAVGAIDARREAVRADFAAGRTVDAAGWLLAAAEAEVLVAYAGACPMPAC